MRWRQMLRMRLRMLLKPRREYQRLDAELEFHLEQETAENIALGMTREEARQRAMRSFGNTAIIHELAHDTWSWTWLERLLQDIRFAGRQITRAPGFALVAILTLALGIGANTAVFTLTHALLLSSLPVQHPEQLVRLTVDFAGEQAQTSAPLSLPMLQSIARRARSLGNLFGWCVYDFVLKDGGAMHGIHGAIVSGNAFETLGVLPAAGRLLLPADDRPGGGPAGWAAVISHRLWIEHYHADPSAVGRQIDVTDRGVTIVGVAPEGFEGVLVTEHPDIYLPLEFDAALNGERGLHSGGRLWLTTFARLNPGVSRGRAAAEMSAIFSAVKDDTLPPLFRHAPVVERSRLIVNAGWSGWSPLRTQYKQPLLLLQLLVVAVLLICCANLSGLLLARTSARRREFAIRAALGASRPRLMRQLFVESVLLALPGALLGSGLAWSAGPWILHSLGDRQAGISLSARPDFAVLAITTICALLCALLFGTAPALIASHVSVDAALRVSRAPMGGGGAGMRRLFIPFEVALCLVLVVVAALLGTTVVRLRTDNAGYRTSNVLFFIADFNRLPETDAGLIPLYRRITTRMEEIPGVMDASVAAIPPLRGRADGGKFVASDDVEHTQPSVGSANDIGAHFFSAIGTPLLAGRDLRNEDADADSCILNQAAIARYFPSTSALGKMLRQLPHTIGDSTETTRNCQVIGIAQDAKYESLREAHAPIVYRALSQSTPGLTRLYFVIHAHSEAEGRTAYHTALHEMAPGSPETDPFLFTQQFSDSIAREQLLSVLSGFFAGLGLLLSGIGIYGLVAWGVTQRTPEIGVRMAMGATRWKVFVLVTRQVAGLLAAGAAAGGGVAFFVARSIRGFLFEVQPGDPVIFGLAALMLAIVGVVAAIIPARHAVFIEPVQALRME